MNNNAFGIAAIPTTTKISSKTDALTYAIAVTKTADGLHLDEADRVFRMFLDNITLPDTSEDSENKFYEQAGESMKLLADTMRKLSDESDKEATSSESISEAEAAIKAEKE